MNRLKELRKQKKILQKDLAEYIGRAPSAVSGWETGRYEIDNDSLFKLADFFGVTVDYLLGRDTTEQEPVDDFTYALYNETKELSGEDKQQLINMARFLKSQKENR